MTELDMDVGLDFDAGAVHAALLEQAQLLCAELEARIRAKLSGGLLQTRSGALLASISTAVEDDGDNISITAESTGVPYAGILENGGKTAAHDIVAIKAKALAFMAAGTRLFAKSVHHPGSTIKPYGYLSSSLEDVAEAAETGLKDAVLRALGAE